MADGYFNLNETELDKLLNTPDGPVGGAIAELSDKATDIARNASPVMKPWNYSFVGNTKGSTPYNYSVRRFNPKYQYGPPGGTTASIHGSGFRYNNRGQMYTGVNVHYGPTLFLERPARQIHSTEYMFMSDALDALEL